MLSFIVKNWFIILQEDLGCLEIAVVNKHKPGPLVYLFLKNLYLKSRVTKSEGYIHTYIYIYIHTHKRTCEQRESKNLPFAGSFHKWTQRSGLFQAEVRKPKFHLGLPCVAGDQVLGPSCTALTVALAESQIGSGPPGTESGAHMGGWHCKWWFNLLHYNAGPNLGPLKANNLRNRASKLYLSFFSLPLIPLAANLALMLKVGKM